MEVYFDADSLSKKRHRLFYMRNGSHDPLIWDCKDITIKPETFRDINGYWSMLSEEQQEEIFLLFQDIRTVLDNVFELNAAFTEINRSVKKLYKLHPLTLISHWMETKSDIRFPDNLKEELGDDDRPEQTYLSQDYIDLVTFSIALKVMLPIWGEYLSLESALSEMNREPFALQLLQGTDLINSKEIHRFREFVNSLVENQPVGMKGILDGVGSLAMPEWIFSVLIVKRLSSEPLPHRDDRDLNTATNLIAQMWKDVRALAPNDKYRNSKNEVKAKILPNDASSTTEEDNLSTAESYKAKESQSDGDRITFDHAGKELVTRFIKDLLPEKSDRDLFHRQLKRNQNRSQFNPTEAQLKLAELVVHKYFIVRATVHSNRESAMNVLTMAQVVLHTRGFSTLAELITASQMGQVHVLGASTKLTKEQLEILAELYAYRRHISYNNSKTKTILQTPGQIAIDELFSRFSQYHWDVNSDEEIRSRSELVAGQGLFTTPYNLKSILFDFIVDLRTRSIGPERSY